MRFSVSIFGAGAAVPVVADVAVAGAAPVDVAAAGAALADVAAAGIGVAGAALFWPDAELIAVPAITANRNEYLDTARTTWIDVIDSSPCCYRFTVVCYRLT